MQVCASLQADNHTTIPPLSFLQAGCPSCRPTNSIKALKAKIHWQCIKILFLPIKDTDWYAFVLPLSIIAFTVSHFLPFFRMTGTVHSPVKLSHFSCDIIVVVLDSTPATAGSVSTVTVGLTLVGGPNLLYVIATGDVRSRCWCSRWWCDLLQLSTPHFLLHGHTVPIFESLRHLKHSLLSFATYQCCDTWIWLNSSQFYRPCW